jgi:hypothetical protein
MMNLKGCGYKQSWNNLKQYCGICLKVLSKTLFSKPQDLSFNNEAQTQDSAESSIDQM